MNICFHSLCISLNDTFLNIQLNELVEKFISTSLFLGLLVYDSAIQYVGEAKTQINDLEHREAKNNQSEK